MLIGRRQVERACCAMRLLRARPASIERSIHSHCAVIRRVFAALGGFLHLEILPKIEGAEHRLFKGKTHARCGGFVDG
jgi:hypothetical protein